MKKLECKNCGSIELHHYAFWPGLKAAENQSRGETSRAAIKVKCNVGDVPAIVKSSDDLRFLMTRIVPT